MNAHQKRQFSIQYLYHFNVDCQYQVRTDATPKISLLSPEDFGAGGKSGNVPPSLQKKVPGTYLAFTWSFPGTYLVLTWYLFNRQPPHPLGRNVTLCALNQCRRGGIRISAPPPTPEPRVVKERLEDRSGSVPGLASSIVRVLATGGGIAGLPCSQIAR